VLYRDVLEQAVGGHLGETELICILKAAI